jgi:hypothetical protein
LRFFGSSGTHYPLNCRLQRIGISEISIEAFDFVLFLGACHASGVAPGALLQSTPKAWDLRVVPWRILVLKEGFAQSEAFLAIRHSCPRSRLIQLQKNDSFRFCS